jgi:hypothetical protein
MELHTSFNRDKIISAANMQRHKISYLHYYMVETKLIPPAFRRTEATGTKICTAVWCMMLQSGTWSPMVTTIHAQCFIFQ